MRRCEVRDRDQGTNLNQNGWRNSQSTEDYHAYVTRMQRMLSEADYPPFPNLHAVFKNENGLLGQTNDDHDEHGKNKNQNQNQMKGLQWQTHSIDDYHAYVTRILRTPSIAGENGNNNTVEKLNI